MQQVVSPAAEPKPTRSGSASSSSKTLMAATTDHATPTPTPTPTPAPAASSSSSSSSAAAPTSGDLERLRKKEAELEQLAQDLQISDSVYKCTMQYVPGDDGSERTSAVVALLPHVLSQGTVKMRSFSRAAACLTACIKLAGSDLNNLSYWLSTVLSLARTLRQANLGLFLDVDRTGIQQPPAENASAAAGSSSSGEWNSAKGDEILGQLLFHAYSSLTSAIFRVRYSREHSRESDEDEDDDDDVSHLEECSSSCRISSRCWSPLCSRMVWHRSTEVNSRYVERTCLSRCAWRFAHSFTHCHNRPTV